MKARKIRNHIKKAKISFTLDSLEAMDKCYEAADGYAKRVMSEVKAENARITVTRLPSKCKVVIVSKGVELNKVFL